jgi:hypothetical protein
MKYAKEWTKPPHCALILWICCKESVRIPKPRKHFGREKKGRWERSDVLSAVGVVCNILHGAGRAGWLAGLLPLLFRAPLVYPQQTLWYHCSRTIGSTLQTAGRASLVPNTERSLPPSPRSSSPSYWWMPKLLELLHPHIKVLFGSNFGFTYSRQFLLGFEQFKKFISALVPLCCTLKLYFLYLSPFALQLTHATLQTLLRGSFVPVFKMFSGHHKIAIL